MKKKLLTLGIALTTALSLSACNGDKEKPADTNKEAVIKTNDVKPKKDKDEKVKDSATKASENLETETEKDSKTIEKDKSSVEKDKDYQFATLQEYYDSDDFQKGIKQASDTVKDQIDLKVSLEGHTLVYTYTYLEQMEVNEEAVSAMEEALDSQRGTLELVYKETNETVKGVKDMKIKYVYLNKDGSVLFEKTYDFEK